MLLLLYLFQKEVTNMEIPTIDNMSIFDLVHGYKMPDNFAIDGGNEAMKIQIQDEPNGVDKNITIYKNGFVIYLEIEHYESGAVKECHARTNLELKKKLPDECIYIPQFPTQK